jgi:Leucine-rich repeat (LRR) protein
LKSLELSHNTELSLLECNDNKLTTLDVSNNKELKSLKCFNNLLTSLDVSENGALSNLDCTNNPFLTEIWLKTGQAIGDFKYDTSVATIKYKD